MLDRIVGKSTTVVYPDGNVAWETMAAERGFEVEAVSHQRKQFTRKIVQRKSTSPSLAGTQIIDRAWRSLKNDWWPQHVNATSKVGGHTMMSNDIKSMVHQWVWRQSLGPATPLRLLEELKRLLKHWWKNAVKCRFAVVWKRSKTRKRKNIEFFTKIPTLCHGRLSSVYLVGLFTYSPALHSYVKSWM